MKYETILRFSIGLFNVERLQLNFYIKEIPTINTLTSERIEPIFCGCKKGYVNTAQFIVFCINGMDVTNGLKVHSS